MNLDEFKWGRNTLYGHMKSSRNIEIGRKNGV